MKDRVLSPVMLRRHLAAVALFLIGSGFGVFLVVSLVTDWPTGSPRLRGLARGAAAGAFGALLFWSGYRAAAPEATALQRRPVSGAGLGSATLATPEESKRWLQKFLEEQQRAGKGDT